MTTREDVLAQVAEDDPRSLRAFRKAYSGESLRACVTAFCLECIWMDREGIRDCTALACPLYKRRPFQRVRSRKEASPASG